MDELTEQVREWYKRELDAMQAEAQLTIQRLADLPAKEAAVVRFCLAVHTARVAKYWLGTLPDNMRGLATRTIGQGGVNTTSWATPAASGLN